MTERPIFRNIQHVPKVWGVTYFKIFITLGIGLLFTTVAFSLAPGNSTAMKLSALGFGVLITALAFGVCIFIERQGEIVADPTGLKNVVSSHVISQKKMQIKSKVNSTGRRNAR